MSTKNNNQNNIDISGSESYQIETNSLNSTSYSFFNNILDDTSNVSMDVLQNWIKYPMIYNSVLREISKQCYNSSGFYARSIDTKVSLPLLSYITIPRNRNKKNKNKNKKNKNKLILLMKILGHEKTTRDIIRKLEVEGIYVGIFRDTKILNNNINPTLGITDTMLKVDSLSLDENQMIQPLDLDYVKIIGFQNNISIACFDMTYFDQFKSSGLINEIKNYPKSFIKGYSDYKKDANKRWFVLDYKKTIALTARSNINEPYGRPYGLQAFADMKIQNEYVANQYKLINELASSIYYLTLPQGEKMGTCSLNKQQQDGLITAFKNAVKINNTGRGAKISTLTLPPNAQIDRLSKDASLLKDTLSDEIIKKISTNLGFASSALNSASEGSSGFAGVQVNMDIISSQVFQLLSDISREYTRVFNEYLNISPSDYIDIKYLPISYLNKDSMYDKFKELYTNAGGSRSCMIAATGINPEDYYTICDEEIEDDLDNKYKPHLTSYTLSDSADKPNPDNNFGAKNGRPQKEEKDLGFKGNITRNNNSNNQVKPSTK